MSGVRSLAMSPDGEFVYSVAMISDSLATFGRNTATGQLSFVDAIRDTGATCSATAVIFFYGIFEGVEERLSDHGVQLLHLCTWWDVLEVARAREAFDAQTLDAVEAYLRNPAGWTPGVMV